MASRPSRKHVSLRDIVRCPSRKVGYQTKAAALDVAEIMMEAGKVNPGCHITPYKCDECPDWHVANRAIVQVGRKWRSRKERDNGADET